MSAFDNPAGKPVELYRRRVPKFKGDNPVATMFGIPIEKLSREELIDCLNILARQIAKMHETRMREFKV